ncbi:putative peptide synthetase [Guyanagaster necrorhizus]|uniref:Peptide synthetase n=1 Tax=Guyanagaster necrorhizus TaxID=856835 RepID=A0A9P8AXQ9_9AGAR|nr:putative peptide synthetase [Guyanagaster necrorhizus MCA 3950]KAG7451863.1 putative peptide synthetase [Guyanagaster necrorhizus MCA 3950]
MDSLSPEEPVRALPPTRVPCFFPSVVGGAQDPTTVIKLNISASSSADVLAFAAVVRTLIGTTGEFAFRFQDDACVIAEGKDEQDSTESVITLRNSQVTGLEAVEVQLSSSSSSSSEPKTLAHVLFHLQIRSSSLVLQFSEKHIPNSLAWRLLHLYTQESGTAVFCTNDDELSLVNHPPQAYPFSAERPALLHGAFLQKAAANPDATAVDFLDVQNAPRRAISYRQLDQRSYTIARILHHFVHERKSIIPLAVPPSPELYVGYISVLRAGCAFSPLPGLDTAPVERILELVRDVGAPVVLGMGFRPEWMDAIEDVHWVDVASACAPAEAPLEWEPPCESDLAYVLFTSGSTGKPKGVQITHLAAACSISSHLAVRALPPGTRWFQFAAATFDPSLMETFMNFSSGTTICAANRQRLLTNPEAVLSELNCSHMMATPSFAAMLRPERIGPSFELWTMGERLSERVIEAFSKPDQGYVLCNAYGPTEAAINVTLRLHPRNESGSRLGSPISTASMMILHPTEPRLVPLGFPGELGLGGPQLAKGYLNMPEQTSRAFIEIDAVGRVYRTGDRARVVIDDVGEWSGIEYLGRMGMDQVKLSGRRVELGEIEAILSAVSGVQSAHAVVHKSDSGVEQLLALITPEEKSLIDEVRRVAEARLPAHMRPVSYFLAQTTPKSTAGKADRRAIAKLVAAFFSEAQSIAKVKEDAGSDIDPEILKTVVKLVAETAELEETSVLLNSSFIALGIDSLRGVRFLTLAREAGLKSLAILDVLQNPTPVYLARRIMESQDQDADTDVPTKHVEILEQFAAEAGAAVWKEHGHMARIMPATPMQASLLALYLRSEGQSGYINHSVYTLTQGVDSNRFKQAWEAVVHRNAILRTSFILIDNSTISPFALVSGEECNFCWIEESGGDVDMLVEDYVERTPRNLSLRDPWAVALMHNTDSSDVRFVLTLHHALFDGASLALMLEELAALYHDPCAAVPREDFKNAIIDVLNADMDACNDYWVEELKDFTPDSFPDLTGLRQSAKQKGFHVSTVMSSTSMSDLARKARKLNVTPLAVVQAAWASILLAYSESDAEDIVFGSIVGGRTSESLEHTVGPMFTAVPVRVRNVTGATTRDLLSRLVRSNVDSLIKRHPPVTVLSGTNGIIYDTTVALQQFGQGASQTELWTSVTYPAMATEFAVVLEIWPEESDLIRLRATCSNNVLIPTASEAMLQQFDDILSNILDRPPDLPFLHATSSVRHELQASINPIPTLQPVLPSTLIHHEFEQNARLQPDALAVWFKADLMHQEMDVRWTYGELDRRANQLAHHLVKTYGELYDILIPLCMEKCPELYVAILGVVKAGGCWCPVDHAAPELRKKDLFLRAGGPVVLVPNQEACRELRTAIPEGLDLLALNDIRLLNEPENVPVVDISSAHLAYLIWTSGTTGAPKGVPIEHRAAVQALTVLQEVIPFNSTGVRCLNFSAYTFDVSILDVFYALGKACGTLCSSSKDILVGQFADVVNSFQATHAFLTPAFMAQSTLNACNSLESLISIGEKLPDTVADAWSRPGTVSLNTYGPAEATIIATYRRFRSNEITKAPNVGLPLPTVSCVAVKNERVLLRGAVGELALGGHQNARGYHNQLEMTLKKFINHPIAGKIYLTGDIVRFLHDGTCEFVGRNDDLVKLGGIRVELSEISAALGSCHLLAREASTMLLSRPDRPQKVVCTFISAPSLDNDGKVCTNQEAVAIACAARRHAELSLPVFMHPNVIVVVQHIPHTASNKIDRAALGEYYASMDISAWESVIAVAMGDDGDKTWSNGEEKIRTVLSDLTDTPVDSISKTTRFAALGIDSIRAVQLASRLRGSGLPVAVSDILRHPSTKQLARMILSSESDELPNSVPICTWFKEFDSLWRPRVQSSLQGVERILPCTPLQEGMLGETIKHEAAYWSHRLFSFGRAVDLDKLLEAWVNVATCTEALRIVFLPAAAYSVAGGDSTSSPVFIQALLQQPLVHATHQRCNRRNINNDAEQIARSIVVSRIGSQLPPWSLTIFETDNDTQSWLMLSIHHALYDADAIGYLLADVQTAYQGGDLTPRLQLSSALSLVSGNTDPKTSDAFWQDVLSPFADEHANLWPNLSSHEDCGRKTRFYAASFEPDRTALAFAANEVQSSISHVLQAAWSFILSSYLRTDKVVFGETLSLRVGNAKLASAIAPLITTTPVAANVTGNSSPRSLISAISSLSTKCVTHRFVSLQRVRRILQKPVRQPVFPAIFVIYSVDEEGNPQTAQSLWTDCTDIASLGVEHPLAVNVAVTADKVVVNVLGSSDFMASKQVKLLADQFSAVLTVMLEALDRPLSKLSLGLKEHHLSVLKSIPFPTSSSSSGFEPVHWLAKRALTSPDDIAVSIYKAKKGPHSTWTFRELDEASNRIANWIRRGTTYPGVIALCMPQCHALFAYQFGILKSGSIYLPIGYEIPAFRKRLLFRAGGATLVFTVASCAEDFVSIEPAKIIDIDDARHAQQVSRYPASAPAYTAPEVTCIMFGDGHLSTSRPCFVSSSSVVASVEACAYKLHLHHSLNDAGDFLSWLPLSCDGHLLELLLPFRTGMTITSVPRGLLQDDCPTILNNTGVTHAILLPAWLERKGVRPCDVPRLRCTILTGHLSHSPLLDEWTESSDLTVLSAFGLSETAGICFLGKYCSTTTNWNVGNILGNYTALILHAKSMQPTLRGEEGELYLSGKSVCPGHLPGLVGRFVLNTPYGPILRTGSIARVRADESVDLFRRNEVFLRGRKLDLAEISEAVSSLAQQGLNVHTLALDHPEGLQTYVVSFISRSMNADPFLGSLPNVCMTDATLARAIHSACRSRLSRHLIPDKIIPLDFIPLANVFSSQVDHKRLKHVFIHSPLVILGDPSEQPSVSRPLTTLEKEICNIVSGITRVPVDAMNADTTTLELGIDSLSAISLSFQMKAAGFFVPPHVILAGPSVSKLAKSSRLLIEDRSQVSSWRMETHLEERVRDHLSDHDIQLVQPCLPLQEGLIAHTLNSAQPVYVNHFILRLDEADVSQLRNAIDETIAANDILRTCFFIDDRNVVQVVLSCVSNVWSVVEVSDDKDPLVILRGDIGAVELDVVQNIGTQPPIRLALYSSKAGSTLLRLTMHHAIYDGESLPMLLSEIYERYLGCFTLQRAPISRLISHLAHQSQELARSFYSDYLDNAPKPAITHTYSSLESNHERHVLGVPLSVLEQTARALNISLHVLALSAFGIALGEHQKINDSVFGVVLSGRTLLVDGVDNMLAPCITTVPVRVRAVDVQIFADIARQVQVDLSSVMEHQHTPLRLIQRWLGSGEQLFDTLFNFSRSTLSPSPSHKLWSVLESKAAIDHPLAVAFEADPNENAATIFAGYTPSFGLSASVTSLLSRMANLVTDPTQTITPTMPSLSSSVPLQRALYDPTTWSPREILVRDVVAKLCNVDPTIITKDLSFLHLGVDSITSIRLAQQLRAEGFAVPTFAIMRHPCIGKLVGYVNESSAEVSESAGAIVSAFKGLQTRLLNEYGPIVRLLAEDDIITAMFPATPLQTGMLTQTVASSGRLYMGDHVIKLHPSVSTFRLKSAWEQVIASTDILRSSFIACPEGDHAWVAAVHSNASIRWTEYSVSSNTDICSLGQKIKESEAIQDEHAFEIPPLSFHLICAPDTRILIALIHHCLYDGLSLPSIFDDVAAAYRGIEPLKRPQFPDAVPFILHSSKDESDFWRKRLSKFTCAPLPMRQGTTTRGHLARTLLTLPEGALDTIKTLGVTVQAVALLAWGKTLASITGSPDVVFGQVVSGRAIDLDNALHASGPLFNTIPFRFTLSQTAWTNAEAVQAQHASNVQSEPHHHVPLRLIQRKWRADTSTGESLFDTLFVFQQHTGEQSRSRSDLWIPYSLTSDPSPAEYPLNLEIIHASDVLEIRAGCQPRVFSEDELQRNLEILRETLENIILEPSDSVLSYPPNLREVATASRKFVAPSPSKDDADEPTREFSPNETVLRQIFSKISRISLERVGLHAPLYALGLDSIAAIQIASRCRSQGLDIAVSDVFAGETIAGICGNYEVSQSSAHDAILSARELVQDHERAQVLELLGLGDEDVEEVLPVLPGQHYHLCAWLSCGGTFYEPVFVYKPSKQLDVDRLRQAWDALRKRHGILRTVFAATSSSNVLQVIEKSLPKNDLSWSFTEFDGDFEQCVKEQVRIEYRRPSTLFTPSGRIKLVRVGKQDALLFVLHHATYDAWSVPLLVADLCALYQGFDCTSAPDFAGFIKHVSTKSDRAAEATFWRDSLKINGSSLLGPKHSCSDLKQVFVRAPAIISSTDSLQSRCQAVGLGLQALVLAVWGRVGKTLTGQDSPVLGVYHTSRAASFDNLERLAGPCVNILPMCIPAADPGKVGDVARQLQVDLGRRTAFEQSALPEILKWVQYDGPLFNIFINLLWHGNKIRTISHDSLLQILPVGVPTDYAAEEPFELRSSVDTLDLSHLPKYGLYIDVALNAETNTIGVAARCHEAILNEEELREVIGSFADGVSVAMEEL